ncbi:hypothetical protein [Microcystis sp. LE19-195.1E]|uniref:hypothetical protein n=1 Tax=Microcystis sp. LE19-195.1E TaxID=3016440 RepID=UPI002585FEFD|nr:hypothetical protein [Microcystis sp. LE19-195.1E]
MKIGKTLHPTPHTLPPPKNFFSKPYISGQALMQEAKGGIDNRSLITGFSLRSKVFVFRSRSLIPN